MQTGAAFNMDGKFPTEAEDKTNYMIMVMPLAIEEQTRKKGPFMASKNHPLTTQKFVKPMQLN